MFKIFEFLTIFDWITPLWGIFQDIRHDPTIMQTNSWTFFINYHDSVRNGWNGFAITGLLKRYGIKTWGSQITNGEFFFSVELYQAQWAEYLLLRNGVPINEKFLGAPAMDKKHQQINVIKRSLYRIDEKIDDIERKIDRYRNPGHIQDW